MDSQQAIIRLRKRWDTAGAWLEVPLEMLLALQQFRPSCAESRINHDNTIAYLNIENDAPHFINCMNRARGASETYSSMFQPIPAGLGIEILDICDGRISAIRTCASLLKTAHYRRKRGKRQ